MKSKILVVGCVGVLGALSGACTANVEGFEATDSVTATMSTASCRTAPANVVLNPVADQRAGVDTGPFYDDPGCNEGYVVDFDGTISGVHVGYKLDQPRILTSDGIRVDFVSPRLPFEGAAPCPFDAIVGHAYLYEKVNGSWQFRMEFEQTQVTTVFASHLPHHCEVPSATFTNLRHGTQQEPHIYRVAAGLDLIHPEIFLGGAGAYPEGTGYGDVRIRACDATSPCPPLTF